LSPRLRDQLERYKMWYRADIGRQIQNDDFIFPQIHNLNIGREFRITNPKKMRGELTGRKVRAMIERVYPELVGALGLGCHTLRRSGAQVLLEAYASAGKAHALKMVSVILGHEDIRTTENYLNTDMFKMESNIALEEIDPYGEDQEADVIELRIARQM